MNHIALRFFVLILLVLGFFVNTQAVDFSELDKLVPEELKQKNTPGAVIVVISGDKLVYQKAFGIANVETNAPMQTEMLFRLGSTTKMFTAAALVALSEKDKIRKSPPSHRIIC
jgi:CubicO group peptidase (beta-lactamase class C family)